VRNLIVCCDGTWNEETSDEDTNVEVVSKALVTNDRQLVKYLRGVGATGHRAEDLFQGGTGTGISDQIMDGYSWLADNYQEGDRIFLFGFSRGAYAARSIAGWISNCGLLLGANVDAIADHYGVYKTRAEKRSPSKSAQVATPLIHFLGAWDTVGALGIPVFGMQFNVRCLWDNSFHDLSLSDNIEHAYHAVACDDIRSSFLPTLFVKPTTWKGKEFEQVWFRGVHSDVGGGYNDGKRTLANVALHWMVTKAKSAGASFDEARLDGYACKLEAAEPHDSYEGAMVAAVSWPRWAPVATSPTDPEYDPSVGYLHSSVVDISALPAEKANNTLWRRMASYSKVGDAHTVEVEANRHWCRTGLILRKDHTYEISAEGNLRDGVISCDANGWSNVLYRALEFSRRIPQANWMELCGIVSSDPRIESKDRGLAQWLKLVLKEDPEEYRRLVFRIGRGPVTIGNGTQRQLADSGFLWLFVNDAWTNYGNNSGTLTVTVRRIA